MLATAGGSTRPTSNVRSVAHCYRAIDQFGQVIDVYVSPRRDSGTARGFFTRAMATVKVILVEVTTERRRCTRRFLMS